MLGIKVYLELRKTQCASDLIAEAEKLDDASLELAFLKANLFGLEAKYTEARDVLEGINKSSPGRPEILIRLIQVCEQLRDYAAAVGYLKFACRLIGESAELKEKRARYEALGLL